MARLKGKKGLDKGVVIDVPESAAEDLIASGDYEDASDFSDTPENFGTLQEWDAHEDYSVHGVRERAFAPEPVKAPKA